MKTLCSRLRFFCGLMFLATLILYIWGFSVSAQEVDERSAFSVGGIQITRYEVEKNTVRSIETYRGDTGFFPSDAWIREWLTGFVDRTWILEDARRKGYYSRKTLQEDVDSMAQIIVTQNRGLLFQNLVKGVTVSDPEIRSAYEKSQIKYRVTLLTFGNHDAMVRIAGRDTIHVTPARFRAVSARVGNVASSEASVQTQTLIWPFWNNMELEKTIHNLSANAVGGPVYTNKGIFFVLLEGREKIDTLPLFETIRENLRIVMQNYKELQIREEYRKTILSKAQIKVRKQVFSDTFSLLQKRRGHAVTHPEYEGNSDVLFSFWCGKRTRSVTVNQFLRFCELMIPNENIDSRAELEQRVSQMAYEICAYADAENRGITRTKQFVLDRRNYLNSAVYNTYEKEELVDRRPVTESDLRAAYRRFPDLYRDGETVIADCFMFDSLENARNGGGEIYRAYEESGQRAKKNRMPQNLQGLVSAIPGYTVAYDSKRLPDATKNILFKMRTGQITVALDMGDGHFGVFVKKRESGNRMRSFQEAEKDIRENLAAERLKENKSQRLNELKRKYTIRYDIPQDQLYKLAIKKQPNP